MKRHLIAALLATLVFPAATAFAEDDPDSVAEPAVERNAAVDRDLPRQELTPRMLYQFLLAEIAGPRGHVELATDAYAELATVTRDPRVARRAAEIALYARRFDSALGSAKLWAELEPKSLAAKQMVSGLLSVTSREDELATHLGQQLADAGPELGKSLLALNGMLARYPDKQAARRLVDRITAPYLGVAEAHFARAHAAHSAGDTAAAIAEIDRALVLRPDWEQAILIRAQLTPDRGESSALLAAFVKANPGAQNARLELARSLVAVKRYDEARGEFRTLLADNPDNPDTHFAVAVLSLQLNDLDDAEARFKQLLGKEYKDLDNVRMYLGHIAEERKLWDDAVQWYGQIASGEHYLLARMRQAQVYGRAGKLDEGRRALRETTATSPQERSQLIMAEAQLLRDANRHDDALSVLGTALADRPDDPDLLYEHALTAEKLGQFDLMERQLRRLMELKPDHAHAFNALGYSLAERNIRLDEAARLIDAALELSPEDAFILDSKGWLLYRRHDPAGALDLLKKAFQIRPDPEIAAHLGEVLWTLGRREEATRTWQEAAKTHPDNEALSSTIKKFKQP